MFVLTNRYKYNICANWKFSVLMLFINNFIEENNSVILSECMRNISFVDRTASTLWHTDLGFVLWIHRGCGLGLHAANLVAASSGIWNLFSWEVEVVWIPWQQNMEQPISWLSLGIFLYSSGGSNSNSLTAEYKVFFAKSSTFCTGELKSYGLLVKSRYENHQVHSKSTLTY